METRVRFAQRHLRGVKPVRFEQRERARLEEAAARGPVSEHVTNRIDDKGQLRVAFEFAPAQRGHGRIISCAQRQCAARPVLEVRFFPVTRTHGRHPDFLRAQRLECRTQYGLDLPLDARARRQQGIDAVRQYPGMAPAQQKRVTLRGGIRGPFLVPVPHQLAQTHKRFPSSQIPDSALSIRGLRPKK